jgi:hypothetical protein
VQNWRGLLFSAVANGTERLRPRTLRCGGRQGSPLRRDERTEDVRPCDLLPRIRTQPSTIFVFRSEGGACLTVDMPVSIGQAICIPTSLDIPKFEMEGVLRASV